MRKLLLFLILNFSLTGLFAGDVAVFEVIGFSADNQYFMFSQYGYDKAAVYADIYCVQLKANDFAAEGVIKRRYPLNNGIQNDGRGAFLKAFNEALPVVKRYNIDYLSRGKLLYVHLDELDSGAFVGFKDKNTGYAYNVRLSQNAFGTKLDPKAAFFITLSVTNPAGKIESHEIGRPGYAREGVVAYKIKQCLASPDGGSLVFVIEMVKGNGDIRYMVETIRVR